MEETTVLSIRIPTALAVMIDALRKDQSINISAFVRTLLEREMLKFELQPKPITHAASKW